MVLNSLEGHIHTSKKKAILGQKKCVQGQLLAAGVICSHQNSCSIKTFTPWSLQDFYLAPVTSEQGVYFLMTPIICLTPFHKTIWINNKKYIVKFREIAHNYERLRASSSCWLRREDQILRWQNADWDCFQFLL